VGVLGAGRRAVEVEGDLVVAAEICDVVRDSVPYTLKLVGAEPHAIQLGLVVSSCKVAMCARTFHLPHFVKDVNS